MKLLQLVCCLVCPLVSFAQGGQPKSDLTFIVYGDQRFTDPANTTAANPTTRRWLVEQIAKERPAAVILNGDVPLAGNVKSDYAVYKSETKPWRDANIRVFPVLGNHEFHGDERECLENWWSAFPELRNRRWYSAQLSPRVAVIALDSNSSLLPGSDQTRWLTQQMDALPASVDFLLLTMHHPPVADIQTHIEVNHNPRPNEIALRDLLSAKAGPAHARFIVSAGHIHNYERHLKDDVVYLVAGGGGAKPYEVERTPDDLYQDPGFPNFHYVKFVLQNDRLRATMYRLSDPAAAAPRFEAKDSFDVAVKPARSK